MRRPAPALIALAATLALALLAPAAVRAQPAAPSLEQVKNATYPVAVAPGGTATLVDGAFAVAAAPGSASRITATFIDAAFGAIAGQPGAAVVLASSGGGSGTFSELYALDAAAQVLAHTSLGDRITLQSLALNAAGHLVAAIVTQGPGEPLCCGTLHETREYALQGGVLVLVAHTATPPAPAATGNAGPPEEGARSLQLHGWLAVAAVLVLAGAARAATGARQRARR